MSLVSLSARTYLRYVVPLTLLSVIAFSPLLALALRVSVPVTSIQAQVALRLAWACAGCSVIPLFILVGGVAPAVRAIASGQRPSQLAVLRTGIVGLAHALVPCLLAVAAIVVGGLAVAVPGLILLVLLALTGASTEDGASARLADSVAIARTRIVPIVVVIATTFALQALAIYLVQRQIVPVPKKASPEHLAMFRQLVRVTAAGIALAAALPAVALAAIHARRD